MPAVSYMSLGSLRLKASEEWDLNGEGLWFVFPRQGVGKYVQAHDVRSLPPESVLIVNAASGVTIHTNGGEIAFQCFSARLEHLFVLCDARAMGLLQTVADGLNSPRLHPATSDLARSCYRQLAEVPANPGPEHRSRLLQIVSILLSAEFNEAHAQCAGFIGITEHVIKVLEGLSTDDIIKLSVEELASKFSCSRRHLNRLFHHYFGVSVAALKMEMRLLKAACLLLNPDIKIIHVGEECGFYYPGFFNTCFKRRFGTNPGQWRKTNVNLPCPVVGLVAEDGSCKMWNKGMCPWFQDKARMRSKKHRALVRDR
ncbi:MAG TPA: helix-turn-helix transcriptional regulator [Candidatus Paceibacterota bacterium]|nr:helix-turn-helix transcriptional regulator [Candidatus Paceibacterota bacterium]